MRFGGTDDVQPLQKNPLDRYDFTDGRPGSVDFDDIQSPGRRRDRYEPRGLRHGGRSGVPPHQAVTPPTRERVYWTMVPATSSGNSTQNVLPTPTSLSTPILPPIISTRRRLMLRPMPVPSISFSSAWRRVKG